MSDLASRDGRLGMVAEAIQYAEVLTQEHINTLA